MKAVLFEKPGSFREVNKDLRRLEDGEALIRVDGCGICGTDLHIVDGRSRSTPPVVLGHEYSGVVEDAGKETALRVGSRVAIDPNISCGTCFYCRRGLVHLCTNLRALGVDRDGGMAQYSIVPVKQLHLLPDDMSSDEGALIEPVSCIVHGLDRVHLHAGDSVVILGGGTAGIVMLQLAVRAGAALTIVVEPQSQKRGLAKRLGADLVIDPASEDVTARILEQTQVGADVVIECVGRPETMRMSLDLARRGGTVEFFGVCPIGERIDVEPNAIYAKELTIVGSYVNPHTFTRSAALLHAKVVKAAEMDIQHFPLDAVHEAFANLRKGNALKTIIDPWR